MKVLVVFCKEWTYLLDLQCYVMMYLGRKPLTLFICASSAGAMCRCRRAEAKNRCRELELSSLVKSVENNKKLSLDVLLSVKAHKVGWLLRVIVSDKGTWQKSVAFFLQEKLNVLYNEDPFHITSSEKVIEAL